MPKVSGSFSGAVRTQTVATVPDQKNHQIILADVAGIQKSEDEKWNHSRVNYWATTDITGGKGSQHGYFVNEHGADGNDCGTFEAKVTTEGQKIVAQGEWKYTGGTGKFKGISGGGTFTSTLGANGDVECKWTGAYELSMTQAHGR